MQLKKANNYLICIMFISSAWICKIRFYCLLRTCHCKNLLLPCVCYIIKVLGPFVGGSDPHFLRILEANPHIPRIFKILTFLAFSKILTFLTFSQSSHFFSSSQKLLHSQISSFLRGHQIKKISFPKFLEFAEWSSHLGSYPRSLVLWSLILGFFKSSILRFF